MLLKWLEIIQSCLYLRTMRWLSLRKVKQIFILMLHKKTYRIRVLSVASVLFCIFLYVLFYALADNYVIDSQYLDAVDQSVLENRIDFHEVIIVKICSDTTSVCYSVYDRKFTQDEHKEVVERHLLIDGFYDESDTVVRLISPKGESFDSSDTRIWGIDHSDVRSSYVAGMLVGPFLLSSLSLDQNDEGKNVLEIGLGGGSFSMALHRLKHHIKITVVELDPVVVKVAHEWFGVKDSTNHRVIVDDGLHFLENALSTGLKFDVLVLDACDVTMRSACPARAFRNASVISRMKDILKITGSLVVNILSNDREGSGSSARERVPVAQWSKAFWNTHGIDLRTPVQPSLSSVRGRQIENRADGNAVEGSELESRAYAAQLCTALMSISSFSVKCAFISQLSAELKPSE